MRFFSLFMSCYLLALSSIPCGDSKECSDVETHKLVSTIDHEEHNHEQESCTPFCYCACCSVAEIYQPIPATSSIVLHSFRQEIRFETRVYSSAFQSFLQLQKLG